MISVFITFKLYNQKFDYEDRFRLDLHHCGKNKQLVL